MAGIVGHVNTKVRTKSKTFDRRQFCIKISNDFISKVLVEVLIVEHTQRICITIGIVGRMLEASVGVVHIVYGRCIQKWANRIVIQVTYFNAPLVAVRVRQVLSKPNDILKYFM